MNSRTIAPVGQTFDDSASSKTVGGHQTLKELYVPIFLKVNLMILTLSVVAAQFANKLAIISSGAQSMSKFVTSRHLLLPFTLRSAALKGPVD